MPARHLAAQAFRRAPCESLPLLGGLGLIRPVIEPPHQHSPPTQLRHSSSASSARWLNRQSSDPHTRASKLGALKSRAAFKLLEINAKHKVFRPGQTVVDLGYAPGSWSQVAKSRVGERGRVVGIDLIPAQPPRGVSTLQGNFLSESVQERLREFVRDGKWGSLGDGEGRVVEQAMARVVGEETEAVDHEEDDGPTAGVVKKVKERKVSLHEQDAAEGRVVDVVLSDMCAPWPLELSTWIRSVNNPYRRMMNTSGNPFRDHAGSMDLSQAALTFAYDTLITGGHFLCKFYQGSEDKAFESRLKKLFERVHRIKPDSSRKESRESYFVGLGRRGGIEKREIESEI